MEKATCRKYVYYDTICVKREGGKYIHLCMYMCTHLYWLLYEQNCSGREEKKLQSLPVRKDGN